MSEIKTPSDFRKQIEQTLLDYRCHENEYGNNEGGMMLVDVLTPDNESTISRGRTEVEMLADYLADALNASPSQALEQRLAVVTDALEKFEKFLANQFPSCFGFELDSQKNINGWVRDKVLDDIRNALAESDRIAQEQTL